MISHPVTQQFYEAGQAVSDRTSVSIKEKEEVAEAIQLERDQV